MTAPLGILILDTAFPRPVGDVGNPASFDFPVRYRRIEGATVERVVDLSDPGLRARFVAGVETLAGEGCIGVGSTCGFLARWQYALRCEARIPVATSALQQVPWIAGLLPPGRAVGIVTFSAADLDAATLEAVGVDSDSPVEGLPEDGHFARVIRGREAALDPARMESEVVAAAARLVARSERLGAIVLECANMPPYRDAVRQATGLPVFDTLTMLRWFYDGLRR